MKYKLSERYNCVVIEFKGNIMGGPDVEAFREELHELVEKGKKNVVADLGRVKFMNSGGLGILIGALTTMKKAGGDLRLANATDKIESLLVVTNLITVFTNYHSLEEAVKSYDDVA